MRWLLAGPAVVAALTFSACSTSVVDWETFKTPDLSIWKPRSVAALRENTMRPVTAEDLVDANGSCPVTAVAVAPDHPGGEPLASPGVPLVPSGIALEMTECDVVKRAGPPEKVEIGANERKERTAVLTYIRGQRPGIYHFTAGRLTSMERAPEPPPPARPARKRRSTS